MMNSTYRRHFLWLSLSLLLAAVPSVSAQAASMQLAQEINQTLSEPNDAFDVPAIGGYDDGGVPAYELPVLENTPDPLLGVEGLHPTRVPLGAISPTTLKTFVAVVDLVRRQYINSVNDEMLFKHAMSGMLSRLDGHAEFLDSTAFTNLQSFTGGNIAGIGVDAQFSAKDNHWIISHVAPDSPADLADIAVGDYLHQINDIKLTDSKSHNDVVQLLSGIAGTQLDIVVSKAGRNKRTVYLQRNFEEASSLDVQMHNGIAVVRLPVFQDTTRQQFIEALVKINTPIQGVVIDVRNNPGGVLESAIALAALFLENKEFVQIAGRDEVQILKTYGNAPLSTMPIVILQNRYSASAAEVLAAGLQANKRATIMGEISYGKGSVQSVIPIDDSQAVKLTTAHYQKPNGDEIENIGVIPDISLTGDEPLWLIESVNYLDNHKLSTGITVSTSNDY
ncbi:MAG: S41 family peptidase [Moraxella sp.]|nr:S41 family peptidase [Moraxella sp.]